MNDVSFMSYALSISQHSHCISTKVGSVLVMDDRIVGVGANNVPHPGYDNKCSHKCNHMLNEEGKVKASERPNHSEWSSAHEVHAEMAAIMDSHIKGVQLKNATLYTTSSPCPVCAKHIEFYAGYDAIIRVVFLDKYDRGNDEWMANLRKYGVYVQKIDRRDLPYIDFDKIVLTNNE